MNNQEQHHSFHHQDHSDSNSQMDRFATATGEANDPQSLQDELEKLMFERAR